MLKPPGVAKASRVIFLFKFDILNLSGRSIVGLMNGLYYTYVLKSKIDHNLYIGHCDDLKIRLKQHFNGEVKSTRYRRPLELVYFEACRNLEKAVKREKYLKTGFGRRYIKDRIGS
jgi:putative endonuclease